MLIHKIIHYFSAEKVRLFVTICYILSKPNNIRLNKYVRKYGEIARKPPFVFTVCYDLLHHLYKSSKRLKN